jgi:hypothetical protein
MYPSKENHLCVKLQYPVHWFSLRIKLVFERNTSCKWSFSRWRKAYVAPNRPIQLSWRNTCISALTWMQFLGTMVMFLTHEKNSVVSSIPFNMLLSYHRETSCKTFLPLTRCIVPWNTCVGPFRLKQVFFKEWIILHFKRISFQKHSFHMLAQFSQGNNFLDAAASNIDGFLSRYHVVYQLTLSGLFATNETFSTLKILIWRMYSFQKLTQYSQANNVLYAPASNTGGFLVRYTCVSST